MSYGPPPGPPPSQPPPGGDYGMPPGGDYGTPAGGSGGYAGAPADPPNDFLVPAILTMFCCFPFAIPAILAAAKVNARWNLGDYAGAQEQSSKAKKFAIIALVVGVIWYIVWGVVYFAGVAAMMNSMPTTAY